MLFNSLQYLIFFPLVVALFYVAPQKWRTLVLLSASYYFYACWKLEYVVLIWISTLIDYVAGIQLAATSCPSKRKAWLYASLAANLGILFSFKYANFFNDALRSSFEAFNLAYQVPDLNVLLPVGISFYTFQSLSYTIEVYRGRQMPEKNFMRFALYVAFFPQLVAGPIERSISFLPQLAQRYHFDYERIKSGFQLILWGFFKKLVVADRCAMVVNEAYARPGDHNGFIMLVATYLFAFQIYCDFSGYTDIARGSARVFGINLMENFRRPYFATSISDFWKRWHISLSTWFRDYVYIPLGGNRTHRARWHLNILIVFVISGLWHGANWTFVVWGALHGIYMLTGLWSASMRCRLAIATGITQHSGLVRGIKVLITFHLVVIAWIVFRADSLGDAWSIFLNVVYVGAYEWSLNGLDVAALDVALAIFSSFLLLGMQALNSRIPIQEWINQQMLPVRWAIWFIGVMVVILFGKYTELAFIYFQF